MIKATDAEIAERVKYIYNMMLQGASRHDICQYSSKRWKVDDRSTDRYIKKARDIQRRNNMQTQQEWVDDLKAKYEELYKRAFMENDKAECRKILQAAHKTLGYEKLQIEHSGSIKTKVNEEQLKDEIDKMLLLRDKDE